MAVSEDVIFISDLRIETIIGIFEWERKVKQAILLSFELPCDCARAAQSDQIDATLDYKAVAKRVIAFVEESRFQLVETLAHKVCELVLNEFGVAWVRLQVNKQGALRHARDIGVRIERRAG
ncbi:MAG: dihydroneopterin aldolase [Gammaproteobacteria bacterium]|nr:dihydroneopterin aldolase [Gammaproteobacteria bacterium]